MQLGAERKILARHVTRRGAASLTEFEHGHSTLLGACLMRTSEAPQVLLPQPSQRQCQASRLSDLRPRSHHNISRSRIGIMLVMVFLCLVVAVV